MSDISVALSTSGHLVQSNLPEGAETTFWRSDIPVCIADMGMVVFNVPDTDTMLIKPLMDMAQKVQVIPDKHYVFVGSNPEVEETGLVIYTEENKANVCAMDFFRRWEATHTMFFQFRIRTRGTLGKIKDLCAIKGIWVNDKWNFLVNSDRGFIDVTTSKGIKI